MANIEIITKEDLRQFKDELIQEIRSLIQVPNDRPKQWLRSAEVRRMLNLSPGTLQNLRVNGTLRFTKVGGIMFYKYDDIVKLLDQEQ